MSEEPKVHLTEDQWAYIKRHENERTKEVNRHNSAVQLALAEALSLMAKSQSIEDKRDWFAGQALASIMQDKAIWDCREDERYDVAVRMYDWADAMLKARARHRDEIND